MIFEDKGLHKQMQKHIIPSIIRVGTDLLFEASVTAELTMLKFSEKTARFCSLCLSPSSAHISVSLPLESPPSSAPFVCTFSVLCDQRQPVNLVVWAGFLWL